MIRILGILTGSAIATGTLIIALGIPEFSAAPDRPITASDTIAEIETAPSGEMARPAEPEVTTQVSDANAETPAPDSTPAELLNPAAPPAPAATSEVTELHEMPPQRSDDNWYAFWSPFRSEIAADGFVTELQRTTGLDYRVVKQKPGVYEVAFAYSNESDLEDKLTRISTATGLDLSGG